MRDAPRPLVDASGMEVSVVIWFEELGVRGRSHVSMARPARHRIELSEEERVVLERRAPGGEAAVPGCAARQDRAAGRRRGWRTRRSPRGLIPRRGWWAVAKTVRRTAKVAPPAIRPSNPWRAAIGGLGAPSTSPYHATDGEGVVSPASAGCRSFPRYRPSSFGLPAFRHEDDAEAVRVLNVVRARPSTGWPERSD